MITPKQKSTFTAGELVDCWKNSRGQYHREDGPAVIWKHGSEEPRYYFAGYWRDPFTWAFGVLQYHEMPTDKDNIAKFLTWVYQKQTKEML